MTIRQNLSDRTVSYLGTAMWSSSILLPVAEEDRIDGCMDVDEDHPLFGISEDDNVDDHFDISDFDDESLSKAESELNDFFDHLDDLGLLDKAYDYADDDRIAHDFWLTRNGHGAGFWDGDYDDRKNPENSIGQALTDAAKAWGGQHIWCDDDGSIHLEDG